MSIMKMIMLMIVWEVRLRAIIRLKRTKKRRMPILSTGLLMACLRPCSELLLEKLLKNILFTCFIVSRYWHYSKQSSQVRPVTQLMTLSQKIVDQTNALPSLYGFTMNVLFFIFYRAMSSYEIFFILFYRKYYSIYRFFYIFYVRAYGTFYISVLFLSSSMLRILLPMAKLAILTISLKSYILASSSIFSRLRINPSSIQVLTFLAFPIFSMISLSRSMSSIFLGSELIMAYIFGSLASLLRVQLADKQRRYMSVWSWRLRVRLLGFMMGFRFSLQNIFDQKWWHWY